jgi:hypothetical protein
MTPNGQGEENVGKLESPWNHLELEGTRRLKTSPVVMLPGASPAKSLDWQVRHGHSLRSIPHEERLSDIRYTRSTM